MRGAARWGSVVAGVMGLGLAAAWADQPRADLWRAALSLERDDPTAAIQRADTIADWLHGLSWGLSIDDESSEFILELRESAIELNLGRVYKMLPDNSGTRHRVFLTGRGSGRDGYELRIEDRHASPAERLGDIDGQIALEPLSFEERDAFGLQQSFSLATGEVDDRDVARTAGRFLRELETAARRGASSGDPQQGVIDAIARAIPEAWVVIDDLVDIDRVGALSASGLFVVDASARIDMPALAQRAPPLHRYLKRMGNLLEGELDIEDGKGQILVGFRAESEVPALSIRFATHDGALVPFDETGSHPSDAIVLGDVEALDLVVRIDGTIRHQGARVSVTDWPIPMHYSVDPNGARAIGTVGLPGSFEMRGESAITDVLVSAAEATLRLDHHADAFFRGIESGPTGGGTRLEVGVVMADAQHAVTEQLDTLLVDNGLIRFGARIVGNVLIPQDDAVAAFTEVERDIMGRLAKDWAAARPTLSATAPGDTPQK